MKYFSPNKKQQPASVESPPELTQKMETPAQPVKEQITENNIDTEIERRASVALEQAKLHDKVAPENYKIIEDFQPDDRNFKILVDSTSDKGFSKDFQLNLMRLGKILLNKSYPVKSDSELEFIFKSEEKASTFKKALELYLDNKEITDAEIETLAREALETAELKGKTATEKYSAEFTDEISPYRIEVLSLESEKFPPKLRKKLNSIAEKLSGEDTGADYPLFEFSHIKNAKAFKKALDIYAGKDKQAENKNGVNSSSEYAEENVSAENILQSEKNDNAGKGKNGVEMFNDGDIIAYDKLDSDIKAGKLDDLFDRYEIKTNRKGELISVREKTPEERFAKTPAETNKKISARAQKILQDLKLDNLSPKKNDSLGKTFGKLESNGTITANFDNEIEAEKFQSVKNIADKVGGKFNFADNTFNFKNIEDTATFFRAVRIAFYGEKDKPVEENKKTSGRINLTAARI